MALTRKSALVAIAGMRVADDTNHAELSAICVTIAGLSLDNGATGSEIERQALEIIAGRSQCADNLMSHQDVARAALASAAS
jgi:hypothetical protein